MAAPTSQRLSFTQLVLDMGLADKQALLKAKKLIKKRKAEGQKLTVARACVELEILSEKQAKRVQLELKRLKEGLASSQELVPPEEDAALAEKAAAKRRARRKRQEADAKAKDGDAEADEEAAAAEAEAKEEAEAEAEPKAKTKAKSDKGKVKAKSDKGKVEKSKKKAAAAEGGEAKDAAPAEDEAAEDEAAEDEAAEDEAAKEGKKKGPTAKKAPAKKGKLAGKGKGEKAKLGKEIPLESQRQEKVKTKGGIKRPVGARKGAAARRRSGEGEALAARKPNNTPYLVGGGAAALLVVVALVVAFAGSTDPEPQSGPQVAQVDPPQGMETPGSGSEAAVDPAEPIAPPATEKPSDDRSAWTPAQRLREAERQMDRLVIKADDLAVKAKFADAIATLEEYPEDLRDLEPYDTVKRDLEKYRKLLPVREEFDAAVAKASDDPEPLKALVLKIMGPKYPFKNEPFVEIFRDEAREALGDEVYRELQRQIDDAAAQASLDDFEWEEDGEDQHELMTAKAAEVRKRGTPERHERFLAAVPTAKANLDKARKILADRVAAEQKRLEEQEKAALKAARKAKLMTDDGKSCELTAFTDHGFTVKVGGEEVTYGWGNCPPKLGHSVKMLAIDTKSAEDVFQLGVWALTRAQFDLAERDFKRAVDLDGSYKGRIPDIEQLKHFTKLFRGKHSLGSPAQVKWEFKADRPQEVRDFKAMHQMMQVELVGGQLKISSPEGFLVTGAEVRGAWEREAKLTVVPASTSPAPIVVVSSEGGAFQVRLDQKTQLFPGFLGDGDALASSDARAMPGTQVEVGIKVQGEKAAITVKLDGVQAFQHEVPFQGEIKWSIGARGAGEARFGAVEASGFLASGWAERTLASAPNLIARELRALERQRDAQGGGMTVPVAFLKTSAEDEVGLEGIPAGLVTMLAEGRQLLEQGNEWQAQQKFREAAERNIEFHAANYLYAAGQVRSDPQGALIRLERCTQGVEDFYEAMVAKAEALFWMGRFEHARTALDEAMALRPDYAPGHLTDAHLSVAELDYETALKKLKLAQVLAPGDPIIETYYGQVTALAEGPAWADRGRFANEYYRLDTDMTSFGAKFLQQLTLMRDAIKEKFPILRNPEAPKRQASLLVFGDAEGYYQYSERTGVGRAEDSLGHFNLWSGQLLLFLEREPTDWNAFHVIFHEGTHQWCYSQGLALPYWFNEGIAEYMGGTELAMDGSRIIRTGATSTFLKQRLLGLTSNWDQREKTWFDIMTQSPEQFYSGAQSLKYGQSWTIVHFIMESGDAKLKETLFKYLEYFVEAAKGDPSDKKDTRASSKLEHIYVDTFHQLDMKSIERKWEKWVEKLANDAGIEWKVPQENE